MGFAPRSTRRVASVDFADCDGNARLRRSENCRTDSETAAKFLSREPSLQQLVVHAEGGAAPSMGVSSALGEQAHRHSRSGGAGARTNESTQRARLTHLAGLSVVQC